MANPEPLKMLFTALDQTLAWLQLPGLKADMARTHSDERLLQAGRASWAGWALPRTVKAVLREVST